MRNGYWVWQQQRDIDAPLLMNLKELKPPLIELPAGQTFFRSNRCVRGLAQSKRTDFCCHQLACCPVGSV